MGVFLDAAYKVLSAAGRPLTAREITLIAREQGLIVSTGKTPWQTMKARLATDILRHRDRSLFMRSDPGNFALREWRIRISEHLADRFQKALFDEDIVVFPRESLEKYVPGVGLFPETIDSSGLLSELRPLRRRDAEQSQSVVQLVSVFVVRHKNRILTHKRTKRLPESRLHGFYSLHFGGHLNPDDIPSLLNIFAPDQGFPFLQRELEEELRLESGDIDRLSYRGLLYDTSRPVSRQHLGIVYEVLAKTSRFEIGERGFLMDAKYETVLRIRAHLSEFENWSVRLLEALGGEWT